MTPLEVFEHVREKAMTALQVTFMESGKGWPDEATVDFMKTIIGIGVSVTFEHLAQHPEHLAIAGQPICTQCREPIQSLQVGADPARDPAETTIIKVAWPCGHLAEQLMSVEQVQAAQRILMHDLGELKKEVARAMDAAQLGEEPRSLNAAWERVCRARRQVKDAMQEHRS